MALLRSIFGRCLRASWTCLVAAQRTANVRCRGLGILGAALAWQRCLLPSTVLADSNGHCRLVASGASGRRRCATCLRPIYACLFSPGNKFPWSVGASTAALPVSVARTRVHRPAFEAVRHILRRLDEQPLLGCDVEFRSKAVLLYCFPRRWSGTSSFSRSTEIVRVRGCRAR